MHFLTKSIPLNKGRQIRSLVWQNDQLVDWSSGGCRYELDGTYIPRAVSYSYLFDAAVVSPSGSYVALYTRFHTKAILLKEGKIVRQLNRDFYHSHVYDYPIAFGCVDGRDVVIHCPVDYCQLEIGDAETGESLTSFESRDPADFFHSRISVSLDGKWLMSGGWVWHPIELIRIAPMKEAIDVPGCLDNMSDFCPPGPFEISASDFVVDDLVLIATSDEEYGEEAEPPGTHSLATWRIGEPEYDRVVKLGRKAGRIMGINENFAVTFFNHPRLIDLRSGNEADALPNIDTGSEFGPIMHGKAGPPIAIDHKKKRFAVASESELFVVELRQ